MIESIDDIHVRIKDRLPPDAEMSVHGNKILSITRGHRYVRVVCAEEATDGDAPFLYASYSRGCLPKTAFYTDPWAPFECDGGEVVALLSRI